MQVIDWPTIIQWFLLCLVFVFCSIYFWHKSSKLNTELSMLRVDLGKSKTVVVNCPYCGANIKENVKES